MNRKRILLLMLVMLLALPVMGPGFADATVAAANGAVDIPVTNGSFEQVEENGTLPGWRAPNAGNYDEIVFTAATDELSSAGENSLHIYDNEAANGVARAAVVESDPMIVVEGASYTVTADVYLGDNPEGRGSNRPLIQVTYYDESGTALARTSDMSKYIETTRKVWVPVELTTTAPVDTAFIRIILISSGSINHVANVHFDNIRLSETAGTGEPGPQEPGPQDPEEPTEPGIPPTEGIEDLGVPLQTPQTLDAAYGQENGANVVYTTVTGSASAGEWAKFNVIDIDNQQLLGSYPLEGVSNAWSHLRTADGRVFIGASTKMFVYSPASKTVTDLGIPLPGTGSIMALTADEAGNVYGGTYSGSAAGRIFRIDAATLAITDLLNGPVDDKEDYVRSIGYYDGHLYAGTGTVNGRVWKIDLDGLEKKRIELPGTAEDPIYDGKFNNMGSVYGITVVDHYLFAFFNGPFTMHVYDLEAETWREKGFTTIRGALAVTSAHNGKVYTSKKDGMMWEIDVDTLDERAFAPFDGSIRKTGFMEVANQPLFTGITMVTISYDGHVVLRNPSSGQSLTMRILVEGNGINLQSLETGPDGKIYVSGYMGSQGVQYNPATGESFKFSLGQSEGIGMVGDTLYFGVYPKAELFGWNTTSPMPSQGPDKLAVLEAGQDRPFVLREAEGKLLIGTIAGYGLNDGALTIYDPEASELAGEAVYEMYPGIVKDQGIAGLLYKDGIIYGGTAIHGGLGSDAVAPRAKLFAWDTATKQKIHEWDFNPDNKIPTLPMISGLTLGEDGLIWAAGNGYIFAFDPGTYEIVKYRNIHPTVTNYGKWRPVYLKWGSDGLLYSNLGAKLAVIHPETLESKPLVDGTVNIFSLDAEGSVYFADAIRLKRLAAETPTGLALEGPIQVYVGTSAPVEVNGELFGWDVDLSSKAEFTVSDPEMARIENGRIIPLKSGTVTVRAEFRGVSSNEINVTVLTPLPVAMDVEVENGSFEAVHDDGSLPGWSFRGGDQYDELLYFERSEGDASDGAHSMYVYDDKAESGSVMAAVDSEPIPVREGRTYKLLMDVYRGDNPGTRSSNRPLVHITYLNEALQDMPRTSDMTLTLTANPPQREWGEVVLTHTAPLGAAYMKISLVTGGANYVSQAYFDNVRLLTEATPGEGIEFAVRTQPVADVIQGSNVTFTAAATTGARIVVTEDGATVAEAAGAGMDTPVELSVPAPSAGTHSYKAYAMIDGQAISFEAALPAVTVHGLSGIQVNPDEATISLGAVQTLSVSAVYGPLEVDVTDQASFETSNGNIVRINGKEIEALAEGSATVTITYGGQQTRAEITVSKYELQSIAIELPNYLYIGDSATAEVTARYLDVTDQSVETTVLEENVSLISSSNATASVDALTVTGLQAGETKLTARYQDEEAQATLIVLDPLQQVEVGLPVHNAGFEELNEDGSVKGWSIGSIDESGVYNSIESSTEYASAGERSVKIIDASTELSPLLQSELIEIIPGRSYKASVSMYLGNPPAKPEGGSFSSSRSSFQVRYYDADGIELVPADLAGHNLHLQAALGRWHTVDITTDAPADAKFIRLNLFTSPLWVSTVYYDEAKVTMMAEPEEVLPRVELAEPLASTTVTVGSDIAVSVRATEGAIVQLWENEQLLDEAVGAGDALVGLVIEQPATGSHEYRLTARSPFFGASNTLRLPVITVVNEQEPVHPDTPWVPVDPDASPDGYELKPGEQEVEFKDAGVVVKVADVMEGLDSANVRLKVEKENVHDSSPVGPNLRMLDVQLQLELTTQESETGEWHSAGKLPRSMMVEIDVSGVDLQEVDAEKLGLYRYDEANDRWVYVRGTFDRASQAFVAAVDQPGEFALMVSHASFADIQEHWAQSVIEVQAGRGFIIGRDESAFDPNSPVTRAEFTSLLVRMLGLDQSGEQSAAFQDMDSGDWYAGAVAAAMERGIVTGTSETTFAPNAFISRQEMAVMLSRILTRLGVSQEMDGEQARTTLDRYEDAEFIADWALEELALLVDLGLINGRTDDSLAPSGVTTRAEAAVMLQRLADAWWEMDPAAVIR